MPVAVSDEGSYTARRQAVWRTLPPTIQSHGPAFFLGPPPSCYGSVVAHHSGAIHEAVATHNIRASGLLDSRPRDRDILHHQRMRRVSIFIGSVLLVVGLGMGFIPVSAGGQGCGSFFLTSAPVAAPEPMPATVVSADDLAVYNASQELSASVVAYNCAQTRSEALLLMLPFGLLGFLVLGGALVYRRPRPAVSRYESSPSRELGSR